MTPRTGRYSFGGDLMHIAWVGVVVAIVVGLAVHFAGGGAPVVWGVLAGVVSTLVMGPVSGKRAARSNASSK